MSKPSDFVRGTLDLLLVGNSRRQVSDGSLDPALHKLELEGWITAE
jgi:PadR family transcriptional regulator, regulatory protein PadR